MGGKALAVAVPPSNQPNVPWTEREIADAKAECAKALAGLALDYQPVPPIKEGFCGAPAPILVKSIGSDPKVEIDPPATVTCPLAAALGTWLSKTVQPEAKALLSSQVIKLKNATSYSCRNRYGGADTPLSEHALANAIDISEFVFTSGERITVLQNWPSVATAQSPPAPEPAAAKVVGGTNPFERPTTPPEAKPPPSAAAPLQSDNGSPSDQSLTERESAFAKFVHDDACNTFGTVLGPEANEAHKNHFHLDMKARRHAAVCQ